MVEEQEATADTFPSRVSFRTLNASPSVSYLHTQSKLELQRVLYQRTVCMCVHSYSTL